MNLAAAMVGVLLGILLVIVFGQTGIDLSRFTSHNPYFVVSGVIYPRLSTYSLFLPPLLSCIGSLLAGVWPAFTVTRKSAAEVLRLV